LIFLPAAAFLFIICSLLSDEEAEDDDDVVDWLEDELEDLLDCLEEPKKKMLVNVG